MLDSVKKWILNETAPKTKETEMEGGVQKKVSNDAKVQNDL